MIESGLLFLLGFLVAGFIALIIAPSIWRRAVFLTRQRIESALPLSLNELQAEKDKLRAEYAVSQRKVEIALEKQREKYTGQANIVAIQSETIKSLKAQVSEKSENLKAMEEAAVSLRGALAEREAALNDSNFSLSASQAELSVRTGEIESLMRLYEENKMRLSDNEERYKQMQLQETQLKAAIADLRDKRQEEKALMRETRAQGQATAELLKTERIRAKEFEVKYERLVAENSDLEARLARRERELERLQEEKLGIQADAMELETRLADSAVERKELESELADYTLRFNRLSKLTNSAEPDAAFEALQAKAAQMELQLKSLEQQLSNEPQKVSAKPAPQGVGLGARPIAARAKGDEMLREQLSQLAAEVVHMTALVEGKDSRINQLLDAETDRKSGQGVISLADRIKALQKNLKRAE